MRCALWAVGCGLWNAYANTYSTNTDVTLLLPLHLPQVHDRRLRVVGAGGVGAVCDDLPSQVTPGGHQDPDGGGARVDGSEANDADTAVQVYGKRRET